MWNEPASSSLRPPSEAATRQHARSHEEPGAMGDDNYLRPPSTTAAGDGVSGDGLSRRKGKAAAAAGMARRGSSVGSSVSTSDIDSSHGSSYDQAAIGAGMPIGFLAALGTPYAKKPIFRSRKCKILCPILGLVTAIVAILLGIFPIVRGIAVHTLSVSVLQVSASNITMPTNNSFHLTLEGQAKKVGIFPARLFFERPIDVYWIAPENLTEELHLGQFPLEPIGVANGHGRIKQETDFQILNEPGFARFTQYLITQKEFTWRLKSTSVQAKAFGFIAANKLNFVKDLTLPGIGNFTDVYISDFQLPGNDPQGGISVAVQTKLTNPSAFGVEIGTLAVDLYYQDLYLGPAQTATPINLTAGVNTVNLRGRLIPYTDNRPALEQLSVVFSNYLNGIATPVKAYGRSVTLPDGRVIDWLQKGITALVLNVPLSSPTGPISPIKSIAIEALSLSYTPETAYSPQANSSSTTALFALPFGFSLDISQVETFISIVENNTAIASLHSPPGPSVTELTAQNSAYTTGNLDIVLPPAPLMVNGSYTDHLIFSQFQYDLTTTNGSNFFLVGKTNAVTDLPIGQVKLTDIGFTVPSGLVGLEKLLKYPTTILSVDVLGGTTQSLILAINVGLTNPSNLDLTVGNVTFQLFAKSDNSFLGTTVLPDLHLTPGYQEHVAVGYFEANNNPTSLKTLNDFASGRPTDLVISGFNGSTQVDSLTQAFMAIHLNTTLNGLTTKLLAYANLTVLPTTGVTNNVADTIVALDNPFTSPLSITSIQSNVTAYGLFVGAIESTTVFNAVGKGQSISPTLPLGLNLFPPDIFALTRALAVTAGEDPTPLDVIVGLGGYQYAPTTANADGTMRKRSVESLMFEKRWREDPEQALADLLVSPAKEASNPGLDMQEHMLSPEFMDQSSQLYKRQSTGGTYDFTGFNLPDYVLRAFAALRVNVDLVSDVTIGEYSTQLTYAQTGVPAYTDQTLVLLLPILARPIVQKIVDGSILNVDTVLISNPSNAAFTAGLTGSIRNAGPFDAVISFPQGLTVAWNGRPLGQIAMPDVSLVANVGATLDLEATTSVADVGYLTEFTGYLLNEPSFTWQIYGEQLSVTALGITVTDINILKTVVLDGLNGLKGLVRIDAFDLPANDPAGGVALTLQTTIQNPSSVGVALSTIGFQNFFGSTNIGPASSTGAFALTPKSTINLPLAGRLIPQTSSQGLQDVSTIFNGYLHGVPSSLVVAGNNAGPADCTWLNEGIKTLKIPVILPAAANLQVITAITINQVTLMFSTADAYDPPFSTDNTVAQFQLPFAFPVDIRELATTITSSYNGQVALRKRLNDGQPCDTDDGGKAVGSAHLANSGGSVSGSGSSGSGSSGSGSSGAGAGTSFAAQQPGDFATLAVPQGPADTDVVARTTLLTFQNVPFQSINNGIFSTFLHDTTVGRSVTFGLHGSADTITRTAIGDLSLTDIAFSVDTNLLGLQGLNARPATVSDLDVYHGYPDYLQINVNANLFNPSNITIGTGDVAFGVRFLGQRIGSAVISGLVLVPGVNIVPTEVRYSPQGDAEQAAGQQLLENYIQAVASDTTIFGTTDTTPIASLQYALSAIQLATVIPPYTQNLVTQAALTFPLDIGTTGIATATTNIQNPFTASINLLGLVANATYNDLFLGQINVASLNPPISVPGHTQIMSAGLPFSLNTNPKVLSQFLIEAAQANGVNLGALLTQLQYLLGLSDAALAANTVTASVNTGGETCKPTGTSAAVENTILQAVQNLRTNLSIDSQTSLDDYRTPLSFKQFNVPTVLDRTVLYLTTILGPPLVQNIVNGAGLSFSRGQVTNVTDNGFTAALTGSLTNAGPFDALISFPEPVQVIWQGSYIADLLLPPICSAGSIGVPDLQTTAILQIVDLGRFTDFATYILLNPGFTWTIFTNSLRVAALDTFFDNVVLQKDISFLAFNKLPGVTIMNPNFPGDSGTNIILQTDSIIPNPSNLGIELGHVDFIASFQGQEVGPVSGDGLVLPPLGSVNEPLSGFITRRTSQASTDALGVLFSNFLQGKNSTLQVTGVDVITPAQPDRPVNWLSTAFKQLTLDVVLPGKIYTIISKIQLEDLTVTIVQQSQAYAPLISNNQTDVTYQNPFGFSLTAIEAGGGFYIRYGGTDAALLTLPTDPVVSAQTSTGNPAALVLNFMDKILQSLNNGAFNAFFTAITNTANVAFDLHGGADVLARTVVGDIPITGIPFDVPTSFPGIAGFGGQGTVPQTPVVIGSGSGDPFNPSPGGTFIRITLSVILNNPAPLIIHTNFVSFAVIYQGTPVGRAYINPLDLYRNTNTIPAEFHYQPETAGDPNAEALLTAYLETAGLIPLTVQGDTSSSPYGSLAAALDPISLSTPFPGQGQNLVQDIKVYVDFATALCKNMAEFAFRINNRLETSITIQSVSGTASQLGTQYASFDSPINPALFAARGALPSDFSGRVPLNLTQGFAKSIVLLLRQGNSTGLDIDIQSSVLVDQYNAPSLQYSQDHVSYTVTLEAGGLALDPSTLGQLLTMPLQSIEGLLGELQTIITCGSGGASPSLLPSLPLSLLPFLSQIPGILTGLIGGVGQAIGNLNSLLNPVTSALPVSSIINDLTSTGIVATVINGGTSVFGDLTSALAGGAARATATSSGNVVGEIVNGVTSGIGNIVPRDSIPTPTRAPDSPRRYEEMRDFLAFQQAEQDAPSPPVITPAPESRLVGADEDRVEAYVDPVAFKQLMNKYGLNA